VILGRVDSVDTDRVGLKLLEELDVALARSRVGKRVDDVDLAVNGLCSVGVDFLCEL
jgi:hypothetical protein